jgi:hypothetical protein
VCQQTSKVTKKGHIGKQIIKTVADDHTDHFRKAKGFKKEFPMRLGNKLHEMEWDSGNGLKRTRNLPLGYIFTLEMPTSRSFITKQLSITWYIPECRKCYAGYFGIGRLKERVRIYQKKTAKKIL